MEKIKISITLNRESAGGGGGSGGGTCFTATATPADKVVTISHPLPDETTREEAHEASYSCSASVDATVTYQQRQQAPTHATTNNNNKEEEEEMHNERLQKLQQTTEKQEAEIQRLFSQLQRHKEREEAQTELCRSLQERVGRLEAMLEHLLASSPSFSSSCSASSSEERNENEEERSEEDRKVREEEKENCDTSKREKVVEEEKEQLGDDENYNSVTRQADEDNERTEDEKRQREDEKCGNITRSEGSREADEENEEAEEVKEEERTPQTEKNTEEQGKGKEKEKKRRNSDSSQQLSSSFTKVKHLHTKELNAMKEKEKGKSRSSRAASSSSSASSLSSRTRSSSASGSSSPASFAASTNSGSLTPTSLVDSSSFAPKKHAYLKRKKDTLGPRPKRYPGFGYKSSGLQIAGKRVALTGFTDASQRAQLAADIVKLRGVVIEDAEFDPQTTHVVAATGCARSLKTMGATLKGKWIVSPQWIIASNAAGEFVDESHYGSRYTGPSPFKNKRFYIAYSFSQSSSSSRIRVASLLIDYGGGTLLNNLKKQIDFTLVGGEGEEDQQDEVPSGVALTWSQFVHMIPDPTPSSSSPSYKESSEGSISPTKPSNGLDSPLLSRAATSPMLTRTRTKSSSFTSPSSSPLSSSSPLNSTKSTKIINNDSEENQPSQTSVRKEEEKANSLNMTIRTPEQRRRAIEEAEKGLTGSELQWSL